MHKKMIDVEFKQLFQRAVIAFRAGQVDDADTIIKRILDHEPNHGHALNLLSAIRILQNQLSQALELSARAVNLAPQDPVIQIGRSDILFIDLQFEASLAAAEAALAIDQNIGLGQLNRAKALLYLFRFSEARSAFDQALSIDPSLDLMVKKYLVLLAGEEGRYETAKKLADKLTAEHPSDNETALARSRYALYTLSVTRAEERVLAEGAWTTRKDKPSPYGLPNNQDLRPERRLRIGYLSADVKKHPVSSFLKPVLENSSSDAVFIKLYDVTLNRDERSVEMRALTDAYHDGLNQVDSELADTIHSDQIDILVDLTGIHRDSRTSLFRHRPAPVQASWIGYSGTSGLAEMDYVIADEFVCPARAEPDFIEQIVRLPNHYLCFNPPDVKVWPSDTPALQNKRVTFGSFNNTAKINLDVVRVWSSILNRVPNSILHLKSNRLESPLMREHLTKQFESFGVQRDRLKLQSFVAFNIHFEAYNGIDIALDPFPYCGTTTTVEALWMGVPVVTLAGERWIQRTSYGFLKGIGLDDLCTYSEKDYVETACSLAQDIGRLSHYKQTIRPALLESSICDSATFTKNLETAYRTMWEVYCATQPGQ